MDELSNIAPKLSRIKKETPFTVPDNYFEDFPARLHSQIGSIADLKPKESSTIIRVLKPALGLVASFAIIFMLVYWPLSKFNGQNSMQARGNSEIYDDSYYSLIADLDENSLYSLLEGSNDEENFSDDELVTYLTATLYDYDLFIESK